MKLLIETTDVEQQVHVEIEGTADELMGALMTGVVETAKTIGAHPAELLTVMSMMYAEYQKQNPTPGEPEISVLEVQGVNNDGKNNDQN
jgi:hypothetical protein